MARDSSLHEPASATQSPPHPALWDKRILLLGLLLAIATTALYLPVSHHPFLNLDDNQYVTANPHVQNGLNWETVHWAFTSYWSFNWHPLTWLSHALDVDLFGLDPAGPHVENLALHVLNVLLLFWVLTRATGYIGRSAMVAALFAFHPINVESVAWIAERKNLLSMLFFLLALGDLPLVCFAPFVSTLQPADAVVCAGAAGQAANHHIAVRPFAVGLLAATADGHKRRCRVSREEKASGASQREGPIVCVVRAKLGAHDSGAEGRRRSGHLRQVFDERSAGERAGGLPALSRESVLAGRFVAHVSSSGHQVTDLGDLAGAHCVAGRHRAYDTILDADSTCWSAGCGFSEPWFP